MAIIAGVDFGTLNVRVAIVDSGRGLLASAIGEYPLHRRHRTRLELPARSYTIIQFAV